MSFEPMANKKRKWQRNKPNRPPMARGNYGATAVQEEVRVDPASLPADLSAAELEELLNTLPKPARKTRPKPTSYSELQAMNIAELHEAAEREEVPLASRRRRDQVWAIASDRLLKRIPVTVDGCLEVTAEGPAFLRQPRASYLPTEEDVYVPPSLIERFGLRTGMTLQGELRAPREGEKFFALAELHSVDFKAPDDAIGRTPFKELTPLYPTRRIMLEGAGDNPMEMRIADLITPVGLGQRGLIVAPPRTGKTILLQQIANSVVQNCPEAHLIILLVDERPEEVTDFERSIPEGKREVVSSTFDESSGRHLRVARMVIEKARSLVEAGRDVVILLDSITRLARASNNEAPSNGKLLSGGIEATALQFPKRFFGSARNIEEGGSLTILGTALIETGSKMDEVIFEEFKGTGNMELVLERRLSDRRIFPAIDINRSGTRKEELLFTPEEIKRIWMLRKVLNELDPVEAMEMLLQKMKRTKVNGEFLMTIGS
jgi:transcription termination factor Rho